MKVEFKFFTLHKLDKKTIKYFDIRKPDFNALFLPSGHDKGVKEYLESKYYKIPLQIFSFPKNLSVLFVMELF